MMIGCYEFWWPSNVCQYYIEYVPEESVEAMFDNHTEPAATVLLSPGLNITEPSCLFFSLRWTVLHPADHAGDYATVRLRIKVSRAKILHNALHMYIKVDHNAGSL